MPTTADLLELRGVGQRATSYCFDLLDNGDRKIGELNPGRDGLTPTITQDTTRGVQRDMTNVNLIPADVAAVNPFSDRIRPCIRLEDGSVWPLGVFLFGDASRPRYSWGQPLVGTMVDKGLILDQAVEHSVNVRAGGSIRQAMIDLINEFGLDVVAEANSDPAGGPMAWPPGTSGLQILNDLARAGGYLPVHFDRAGIGRIRLPIDPDTTLAEATYDDGANIYAASPVDGDDLLRTPNRVIVISTDAANAAPIVGVSDVGASAPFSFANRGFRVTQVVQQQGIGSVPMARRAAQTIALSRTIYETTVFSGPPDPRHDAYSVIAYRGERWLEQQWSLPLTASGPMTHTIRKVYGES